MDSDVKMTESNRGVATLPDADIMHVASKIVKVKEVADATKVIPEMELLVGQIVRNRHALRLNVPKGPDAIITARVEYFAKRLKVPVKSLIAMSMPDAS